MVLPTRKPSDDLLPGLPPADGGADSESDGEGRPPQADDDLGFPVLGGDLGEHVGLDAELLGDAAVFESDALSEHADDRAGAGTREDGPTDSSNELDASFLPESDSRVAAEYGWADGADAAGADDDPLPLLRDDARVSNDDAGQEGTADTDDMGVELDEKALPPLDWTERDLEPVDLGFPTAPPLDSGDDAVVRAPRRGPAPSRRRDQ